MDMFHLTFFHRGIGGLKWFFLGPDIVLSGPDLPPSPFFGCFLFKTPLAMGYFFPKVVWVNGVELNFRNNIVFCVYFFMNFTVCIRCIGEIYNTVGDLIPDYYNRANSGRSTWNFSSTYMRLNSRSHSQIPI